MDYQPEIKVRIVEDCRRENNKTGQVGVLEGYFTSPGGLHHNPRTRFEDGSVLWGCECWWELVENMPSLEESQVQLKQNRAKLREVIDDMMVFAKKFRLCLLSHHYRVRRKHQLTYIPFVKRGYNGKLQ